MSENPKMLNGRALLLMEFINKGFFPILVTLILLWQIPPQIDKITLAIKEVNNKLEMILADNMRGRTEIIQKVIEEVRKTK